MEAKKVKFKGKNYSIIDKVCRSCRERIFCVENQQTLLERYAVAGEEGLMAEANGAVKCQKLDSCFAMMRR
ncbi:MAG: hypothetical protein ACRCX4_00885 [Bacteroidales bacterium]